MTHEEIIAQLQALVAEADDPDGYYTMGELSDMANVGRASIRARLKIAKKLGRLATTRAQREALDGRLVRVPVYRILPPQDGS